MDDKGDTVNVSTYTDELAKMEASKRLSGRIVSVIRERVKRFKREVMEA
jgi:hypothetical protein